MRRILVILVLSLVWLIFPAAAADITVEGYGVNQQTALQDALRAAVEQAAGMLISSETATKNHQILSDVIYARSEGYIRDYQIIRTDTAPAVTTVLVRVKVDTEANSPLLTRLQQHKLIEAGLGDPRLAVIIEPTGQASAENAAVSAIVAKLSGAGFQNIVDTAWSGPAYRTPLSGLPGGYPAALEYARNHHIVYLIVGQARVENAGTWGGFRNVQAALNLKLIRADSGDIVATATFQDGGADLTETAAAVKALAAAGDQAGEFAAQALLTYSQQTRKKVTLVAAGIPSYEALTLLEKQIAGMRGITAVTIRSYGDGVAIMTVYATGNAASLSRQLAADPAIALTIREIRQETVYVRGRF